MAGRNAQKYSETLETAPSVLPSTGAMIQAGAFGAAFSGVATGIADSRKVRDGAMTRQEAVHDVAKASLQGAATMAAASGVAHVARINPLLGLGILALAGLGFLASDRKKAAPSQTPSHT